MISYYCEKCGKEVSYNFDGYYCYHCGYHSLTGQFKREQTIITMTDCTSNGVIPLIHTKKTIRWKFKRDSSEIPNFDSYIGGVWSADLLEGYIATISEDGLRILDSKGNTKELCWEPKAFGSVLRNYC
jgi:hypothetical protein